MTVAPEIALLGIGVSLGGETRTNAWWPAELVDTWRKKTAGARAKVLELAAAAEEPTASAWRAIASDVEDPFRGTLSRPIVAGQTSDDLTTEAARRALDKAGIAASDIDLLITYDLCPDLLGTNGACTIHHRLGMRRTALAYAMEGSANSFLIQLELAGQAIRSGAAKYVLITQSSVASPLSPMEDDYSSWFGDAATAVVVGSAPRDTGCVSLVHRTDGDLQGHLVASVPGKRWFDDGRIILESPNLPLRLKVFSGLANAFVEVGSDALARAGVAPAQVDFCATHQGFSWIADLTRRVLGLEKARTGSTHARTANITACNLPIQLANAMEAGILTKGAVVLLVAGGNGVTNSAAVLRW